MSRVIGAVLAIALAPGAGWADGPKLWGFAQADYYGRVAPDEPYDDTFFIRRARLGVRGDAAPTVTYKFLMGLGGANSPDAAASVRALDANATLTLHPLLRLRVGQGKFSPSRDSLLSAWRLPFLTLPVHSNWFFGKIGRTGTAFRDLGAQLSGKAKEGLGWSYALGVFNGNGIGLHDENQAKDFSARATVTPVGGLTLGAGAYLGFDGADEARETAYTADVAVHAGPLRADASATVGEYEEEAFGFGATAVWAIHRDLDLLARYQQLDPNLAEDDDTLRAAEIGVAWYLRRELDFGGTKVVVTGSKRLPQSGASGRVWDERGPKVTGDALGDVLSARMQAKF